MVGVGCVATKPMVHWSREVGPPSKGHFQNTRLGDINRDGLVDLVGGCSEPGGIAVWLGRGDGTWLGFPGPTSEGRCYDVALGDVNSDGLLDVISVGAGEMLGVRVWLNNDDGTWAETIEAPTKTSLYSRVEVADVNNDGAMDIIAASQLAGEEGGIRVWLGDGHNIWRRGGDVVTEGVFRDMIVTDLNGDGNVDVAATSFLTPGGIEVWYGGGGGEWFTGVPPTDSGSFWGISAGDFNNDGQMDLVAGNYQQRGLYIWYRSREKGWESPKRLCKEGLYFRIAAGDYDGDGRLDFAATSADKGGVELWRQTEKGWGKRHVGQSYGRNYHGLIMADLNDDGHPDLVAASVRHGIEAWVQTDAEQVIAVSPKVASIAAKGGVAPAPRASGRDGLAPARSGEEGNEVFTLVKVGDKTFPEYLVGVRDQLKITVHTGLEKTEYDEQVGGDGTIFIPDISDEPIQASGRSPTELRQAIVEILKTSLKNPRADVIVTEFRSKQATLSGEIKITFKYDSGPGQYPLDGMTRLLDFINRHGGPTERADTTHVLVVGKDGTQHFVDIRKAIETGDLTQNLVVDAGDLIYIPGRTATSRKVYLLGEVNAPGVYPITGGERVLDIIAMGRGLNRRAVSKGLFLVRGDANNPGITRINYDALVKRGDYSQNLQVQNGDILYAPQRFITKLVDVSEDVRPILRTVIDYSDTIVAVDRIGGKTWHNVLGGQSDRVRTTGD